eukprot:ctg_2866.g597
MMTNRRSSRSCSKDTRPTPPATDLRGAGVGQRSARRWATRRHRYPPGRDRQVFSRWRRRDVAVASVYPVRATDCRRRVGPVNRCPPPPTDPPRLRRRLRRRCREIVQRAAPAPPSAPPAVPVALHPAHANSSDAARPSEPEQRQAEHAQRGVADQPRQRHRVEAVPQHEEYRKGADARSERHAAKRKHATEHAVGHHRRQRARRRLVASRSRAVQLAGNLLQLLRGGATGMGGGGDVTCRWRAADAPSSPPSPDGVIGRAAAKTGEGASGREHSTTAIAGESLSGKPQCTADKRHDNGRVGSTGHRSAERRKSRSSAKTSASVREQIARVEDQAERKKRNNGGARCKRRGIGSCTAHVLQGGRTRNESAYVQVSSSTPPRTLRARSA